MSNDAGSGFDNQAAGRDVGDERLEEEARHLGDDAGEDALGEDALGEDALEDFERKRSHDSVNDAF
jgi:hypothetical protein